MTKDILMVVEKLSSRLQEKELKIATVESCTGGGLSFWLTALGGSSAWYDRGFVTYTNISKTEMVSVRAETLTEHGAVSEKVALEMAEGALEHSRAQISIAITGIAGPDGGSEEKPVGTVWIAWAFKEKPAITNVFHFTGNRTEVRHQTMLAALEKLLDML